MKDHSLDPLINAYRRKALPSAPANLKQNVWREIRLRQKTGSGFAWQDMLDWILDRRVVVASLATALLIGFVFNLPSQRVSTKQAMGLGVFSHSNYSRLASLAEN